MPNVPPALESFLDAHDWETSKKVVHSHAEILTDAVDACLDQMAAFYEISVSKKGRTVERVREHQQVLQRCREVGIDTAFADKRGRKAQTTEALLRTFFLADTLDEVRTLVERYPELLDERMEGRIEEVVGYSLTNSGELQTEDRRRLLRHCREAGIKQAFAEFRPSVDLLRTIIAFLNTNDLGVSRRFVDAHPELLSTAASSVMEGFVGRLSDPNQVAVARELLELLGQCREMGVERAYTRHRARLIERALEQMGESGAARAPDQYAQLQGELGQIYLELGRPEDVVQGVLALEKALQITPPAVPVRDHAIAHVLLARAYQSTGDPAQAARGVQLLLEARKLIRWEEAPDIWGEVHFQLGVFYTSLPTESDSDKQEENQYTAIQCFKEAGRVCDQTKQPAELARVCRWLGDAFNRMPRDSQDEAHYHLRQAIHSYETALTGQPSPEERAHALEGLAHAHAGWPGKDRERHREQAIECCRKALPLLTPAGMQASEGPLRFLLGSLYLERGRQGDVAALAEGEAQLTTARDRTDRKRRPGLYRAVATALGNLHFQKQDWSAAGAVYADALSADSSGGEESPLAESDRADASVELKRNLAYCLGEQGEAAKALAVLEVGRSRSLRRSLIQQLVVADAPDTARSWFHGALSRLRAARQRVKGERPAGGARLGVFGPEEWMGKVTLYEHGDPVGSKGLEVARSYAEAVEERQRSAQTYAAMLKELAREIPGLRATEWSHEDCKKLTSDRRTAVVVPVVTRVGAMALVLQPDGVRAIRLPRLSEGVLEQLAGWGPLPVLGREPMPFSRAERTGYLGAYFDRFKHFDRWLAALDETLRQLGELFWEPILAELSPEVARVTVVPQGHLWLFPLHAAWIPSTGAKGGREYVLDRYEVSYVPSLGVARACSELSARPAAASLYAVINPQEDAGLRWTSVEWEGLRKLFPAAVMKRGREATRAVIMETGVNHGYVHLASHGRFHWLDVEQSGLRLADGWLTMSDLLSGQWDLRGVRLVTLSACETAMSYDDLASPEEFVSLPGAVLLAGVPCVVGTLWTVEDMSTALLVRRMYANHLHGGMSIAAALREAQVWLRDATQSTVQPLADELLQEVERTVGPQRLRDLGLGAAQRADGDSCPFRHPFFWAGLACVGS